MSAFVVSPWEFSQQADRRFQRIVRTLIVAYVVLGIIIPFIKLVGIQEGGGDAGTTRYATLVQAKPAPIAQKAEEAAPTPEPPQPEPPKPQKEKQQKPEPTPEQKVQQARQAVMHKGILAMTDQFADLRDRNITSVDSTRALNSSQAAGGGQSSETSSKATTNFSASAGSGSAGITSTVPGASERRASGTKLDQRETTTIKSPVGFGRDLTKPGQGGDKLLAGRTLDEIQLTFDRSKSSFYAIFNRAMRENPNISAGKVIVSLTIAPDGSVTDCKLVSSSFGDPTLEGKIVQRVKLLNFGAKDVPSFTYPNYPINFLPS
jgi:protein TonB